MDFNGYYAQLTTVTIVAVVFRTKALLGKSYVGRLINVQHSHCGSKKQPKASDFEPTSEVRSPACNFNSSVA